MGSAEPNILAPLELSLQRGQRAGSAPLSPVSPWHLQHQAHSGLHSYFFFLRILKKLVNFILVALGLCCCEQGFSSCRE